MVIRNLDTQINGIHFISLKISRKNMRASRRRIIFTDETKYRYFSDYLIEKMYVMVNPSLFLPDIFHSVTVHFRLITVSRWF